MGQARRGGILLRARPGEGVDLWFVPASVALRVAPMPEVTRVPGAPAELLGIAQVDGGIVPVVTIGGDPAVVGAALVLCTHLGEEIGLVGAQIVGTGTFDADADGSAVRHEGESAKLLDLSAIYARLQSGPWAGRWRG